MKKILLSSVALIGLTVSAAAADLPSRRAPVIAAAVPAFTWTGFYVGVNAGYGFNTNDNDIIDPVTGEEIGGDDEGGFVGGAQLGYNYQIGSFVLGLETDIQFADLGNNNNVGLGVDDNDDDNEFFGTTRARAGVAFDRFLVYATGGVAYADSDFGWTAGGGVEYAFTDNLTAKVEALYVELDRDDNDVVVDNLARNESEFAVVRAGLNFKFSSY